MVDNTDVRARIRSRQSTGAVGQVLKLRRGQVAKVAHPAMTGGVHVLPEPENFVIGHLNQSPAVYSHQREGDYLHVSDLLGKCVRKMALSRRAKTTLPPERIYDGLGLTFAQGNVIHDYIKQRLAAGHPDKVHGLWGCKCGQTKTDKPMTLAQANGMVCKVCSTPLDQYHEKAIVDDEYGITGSPDIVLYLEQMEAFHPVEIKSINGEDFKMLTRPQPSHILQVVFYWHLMSRAMYRLTDRVGILYSNKAFSFKSPYKEFSIDARAEVHRLEPYLEDAKAYKASLSGGPLPVRSVCATQDTPEAKKCPMRSACFAPGAV